MNKQIAIVFVAIVLLFSTVPSFAQSVDADLFKSERNYGEFPQIKITKRNYDLPTELLSSIQPIRVNDPYATAGQPVILEFTLENIGDELGFPFNQIPLSPDNYSLVLMMDNQYDKIILPNGKSFDMWERFSAWEKFSFAIATSVDSFGASVSQQLEGRSCGYVDIWTNIPAHVQEEITLANNGQRPTGLLNWSCIKIIDEPYFNTKVNAVCGGVQDAACLAKINEQTYVGDSIIVRLVSDVPRNTCERVADRGIGELLSGAITSRMNLVECGLGSDGLKPGQQATWTFVGLVPSDTPVLSPADFINVTEINEGVTQSASCLGTDFPENCHTVYAGVFPTAKDNLLKLLSDATIGNLIKAGNILFGTLYTLDFEFTRDVALTSGGITNQVVGKPIWEGRGIFFIVGPGLKGTINLILLLAFVAGTITGAGLARRTGQ